MQKLILLAAAMAVSGCAYRAANVAKYTDDEVCITRHDTGSISGIPERNAQAEIDRRNLDCKPIMEAYWKRLDGIILVMPPIQTAPLPTPSNGVNCTSFARGNVTQTYCN